MMRCLIFLVQGHFTAVLRQQTTAIERCVQDHVDLVEGQPVSYPAPIPLEHSLCKAQIEVDKFSVRPAAIGRGKIQRHLVMADGHKRLNAVLLQFIQNLVVKFQPLLVGHKLISIRENARPAQRKAEHLKSHLRKKSDIFFIAMIEIDGCLLQIKLRRWNDRFFEHTVRHGIRAGKLFAILQHSTFALVGSNRAAPEKVFRKCQRRIHGVLLFKSPRKAVPAFRG